MTPTILVVFASRPTLLLPVAGDGRAEFAGILLAVFAAGSMIAGLSRPVVPQRHGPWLVAVAVSIMVTTTILTAPVAGVLVAASLLVEVATARMNLHAVWICAEMTPTMTLRAFGLWRVANNGTTAIGAPVAEPGGV